jgi:hypothetical protein
MHVIIVRMTEAISGVTIEIGFGARWRGLLAGPPQGTTCEMSGVAEGMQGGNYIPPKAIPGRT